MKYVICDKKVPKLIAYTVLGIKLLVFSLIFVHELDGRQNINLIEKFT